MNQQLQRLREQELAAQGEGMRRIYADRRRRQARRQKVVDIIQWIIVALACGALAFSVYAGMRARDEAPATLPPFEDIAP